MNCNYKRTIEQAQLPKTAMKKFIMRSEVDKHLEEVVQKHEDRRWEELNAFSDAVTASMLYALHVEEHMGAKKLRRVWEAMIRYRIEFRLFFRDGGDYKERKTGENIEDLAVRDALRRIGVDLKAWEKEEIRIDEKTGEVSFHAAG